MLGITILDKDFVILEISVDDESIEHTIII